MGSYGLSLTLALALVGFGVYGLLRSWQSSRSSRRAWYSVEGRQMRDRARKLAVQAFALLITGAAALLWIGYNLSQPTRTEPPAIPAPTSLAAPTVTASPSNAEAAATVSPTGEVTGQPSPSPAASETEEQIWVPVPTLVLGVRAVVTNTGGKGLWLRDAPYGSNVVLLEEGSLVSVRGGLIEVDGFLWQNVVDPDGRGGWVAADYLLYR